MRLLVVFGAMLLSCAATGTDLRLTGFATVGYAASSLRDGAYLRYIDREGTLKADSLVGAQIDARFDPRWAFTVQGIASAPRTHDDGHEAKVRWAFLSFRPDNDWLIRLGRTRPPIFLHTQNAEVGVTYEQVRPTAEVYSLSPVYDFDGISVAKTWGIGNSELTLDAYGGTTDVKFRSHFQIDPPESYFPERISLRGLLATYIAGAVSIRGGILNTTLHATGPDRFPGEHAPTVIPAPAPVGGPIYQPARLVDEIDVNVLTFGIRWTPVPWQITFEYGRRKTPDSDLLVNDQSAYLSLSRRVGDWTPYAAVARMLSDSNTRAVYAQVNAAPVPLLAQLPPFSAPANLHRLLADRVPAYDQRSFMLGTAYSFSATSKAKLEWMRTRVGLVSTLVDGDVHNRSFNVLSISYSVVF